MGIQMMYNALQRKMEFAALNNEQGGQVVPSNQKVF